MGCFQAMAGKKKFPFQSEYRQRIYMISISLICVCSKEEVNQEANETILYLPKK